MDAFYASVEQRDRPELKGKPVVVGGDPNSRGVVAACSYEARKFGIHSAMPSSRAYKLCPHTIFLRPRFDVYRSVSADIREIFQEYTDIVEPLSLDEAFLDVTKNKRGITSATLIAQEILKKIYERTGQLTASAGVSFNKFLAKVASDFNKPNDIEDLRSTYQFLPTAQYRLIDLLSDEPIREIDIKVWWQDLDGNLTLVQLPWNSQINIKLAFVRKSLYNDYTKDQARDTRMMGKMSGSQELYKLRNLR